MSLFPLKVHLPPPGPHLRDVRVDPVEMMKFLVEDPKENYTVLFYLIKPDQVMPEAFGKELVDPWYLEGEDTRVVACYLRTHVQSDYGKQLTDIPWGTFPKEIDWDTKERTFLFFLSQAYPPFVFSDIHDGM